MNEHKLSMNVGPKIVPKMIILECRGGSNIVSIYLKIRSEEHIIHDFKKSICSMKIFNILGGDGKRFSSELHLCFFSE